jgi:SAM-dependent methyltransferase
VTAGHHKPHWEQIYVSKPADKLGWYEPHLRTSLTWIQEAGLAKNANIIDVGGGASTLVDDLLDEGYERVTVLDLSHEALKSVKTRLGPRADQVTWLEGDITSITLPEKRYELWHDRAVFHFLTDAEQRKKYADNLLRALKPGGRAIIGTFALEAPSKCSGLPVVRYGPETLRRMLDSGLSLLKHHKELHLTPGGVEQMYLYCLFAKPSVSKTSSPSPR